MARQRDDDYEDDDLPAKRSRDRDDDDDDRPARRGGGSLVEKPGGLDGFLGNLPISILVAVVFGFCCTCVPIILGGIGMATCKTPEGKKGAMFMLIIGIIFAVIWGVLGGTGVVKPDQFNK